MAGPGRKQPNNYPREQILKMADQAIATHGGPNFAKVFFKFTCAHCGERCTFSEANTLRERGECWNCEKETVVSEAGFMLQMTTNPGGFSAEEAENN